MPTDTATLADYHDRICRTSIDDAKNYILALLERPEGREPNLDDAAKREILEGCLAVEVRGSNRKALKNAIKSALKKLPATALATVEVTTDSPVPQTEDPAWLALRETAARLREAGRTYLEIQAWMGWQLAQLKKTFDVKRGRPNKSAESADLRTWDELVKHYTGYSRRTADVLIQLFDAAKAKLKRAAKQPDQKEAITLFTQGNPLALPPEKREFVRDVIASLCTGETQGSLMAEFGITPKPKMVKKTKGEGEQEEDDELSDTELAFHHWEGPASSIVKARSPEGMKLLHLLPPVTSEPGKLSLTFLREESAALLAAVEEALAAHAKPAKGKSRS